MLKGTDKEIAKAIRVRRECTERWKAENAAIFSILNKELYLEESATWWLEHETYNALEVLNEKNTQAQLLSGELK